MSQVELWWDEQGPHSFRSDENLMSPGEKTNSICGEEKGDNEVSEVKDKSRN